MLVSLLLGTNPALQHHRVWPVSCAQRRYIDTKGIAIRTYHVVAQTWLLSTTNQRANRLGQAGLQRMLLDVHPHLVGYETRN